jgi:rRNA-processing protein EBP2
MAKKSKLLGALDAHKGRDFEAEKKKKQLKKGEKRSKQKLASLQKSNPGEDDGHDSLRKELEQQLKDDFAAFSDSDAEPAAEEDEDESEGESIILESNGPSKTIPQPEVDPEASASEADPEEDVPLSEVSVSEDEDIVPHQRLTINNIAALSAARKRISIVRPKMPFQSHNSLISSLPPISSVVEDPNDDLTRELEFYRIAKDAATSSKAILLKAGVPFTRPNDYFAEMVKSDEHMSRIKKKMYDEAAGKKAAAEARQLRDAKKFGKKVQQAKEEERAKEKRETLGKIKDLKRSEFWCRGACLMSVLTFVSLERKGQDTGKVNEDDDLFQSIDVEAEPSKDKSGRERGPGTDADGRKFKRSRTEKDKKFGHGGKKRFAKSGDATSSADMKGFSVGRMKGRSSAGKGGAKRPGKSKRAAKR